MKRNVLVLSPLLLFGCAVEPVEQEPGTGTVRLSIADAPLDGVDSVFVTVSEVRLHRALGDVPAEDPAAQWETVWEGLDTFDLLTHQGGEVEEIVHAATVDAGTFDRVQLVTGQVAAEGAENPLPHYVSVGGAVTPLAIPAGPPGLEVEGSFTLVPDGNVDLVVDWDVRRSLRLEEGGDYTMNPVLRLVDSTHAGRILGSVTGEVPADAWIEVSVNGEVKATAPLRATEPGKANYDVHFLPPGAYHVVVARDGAPPFAVGDVTVNAGMDAALDLVGG